MITADGDAAQALSLSTGDVARAAHANADTTKELLVDFSADPATTDIVTGYIQFTRGSGSDSNTGTMSGWDVWFEYTSDE